MQLNEFLNRLKGVKSAGDNQFIACCPVPNHGKGNGDKNPSLSVGEQGGKILLKCHAGCSHESIVGALGLEMKDLFMEEKTKQDIVTVYDYKDLDGNVVHQTVRLNPKGFRQRRPDPDKPGKFVWNMKGVVTVLYNLQAVTHAIKETQPVLVVEGEKDCDYLVKLGFTATTCPMGACKWQTHHSVMLKDGTVYIVADNDEIGKNHAKIVAKSLVGKAESIYLILSTYNGITMPFLSPMADER